MNFRIEENLNQIIVHIDLPKLVKDPRTRVDSNRTFLKAKNVTDYLKSKGIAYGECVSGVEIDNMSPELHSVWKFNKPQPKKLDIAPEPVVSSKRAKRTKKVTKAQDD
jgi:hypothetical protein